METSSVRWDSEQAADECNIMNHFEMNSLQFDALDDFTAEHFFVPSPEETLKNSDSYNINQHNTISDISERPTKQFKTNTRNNSKHVSSKPSSSSSSSSQLISFANFGSQFLDGDLVTPVMVPKDELVPCEYLSQIYLDSYGSYDGVNYSSSGGRGTKRSSSTMARTPSHAQEHVMAERKRRERLTERFIALSAIVPDLKKLDKASVLGDAIKYMKQLQERLKLLEDQIKKKKSEDSVVSLNSFEDFSSGDDNSGGCLNKPLPEIEARVSGKNVLIRVHCEKQKGFIPKVLRQIEKLNLTVINSSVLPFGDHAIHFTIVAQMDIGLCLTGKDLVRNLRLALQ